LQPKVFIDGCKGMKRSSEEFVTSCSLQVIAFGALLIMPRDKSTGRIVTFADVAAAQEFVNSHTVQRSVFNSKPTVSKKRTIGQLPAYQGLGGISDDDDDDTNDEVEDDDGFDLDPDAVENLVDVSHDVSPSGSESEEDDADDDDDDDDGASHLWDSDAEEQELKGISDRKEAHDDDDDDDDDDVDEDAVVEDDN
jgi:hypothetical protein